MLHVCVIRHDQCSLWSMRPRDRRSHGKAGRRLREIAPSATLALLVRCLRQMCCSRYAPWYRVLVRCARIGVSHHSHDTLHISCNHSLDEQKYILHNDKLSFWLVELSTLWVRKKTRHHSPVHNFAKCLPIFKIFSLLDSAVNLQ